MKKNNNAFFKFFLFEDFCVPDHPLNDYRKNEREKKQTSKIASKIVKITKIAVRIQIKQYRK